LRLSPWKTLESGLRVWNGPFILYPISADRPAGRFGHVWGEVDVRILIGGVIHADSGTDGRPSTGP
jgi:hypothetical protein